MGRAIIRFTLIALILVLPATALLRAQDSVSTLAGFVLTPGFSNGFGTNALFADPAGLAADASGNLYVADNANHIIRKISAAGSVTTLAGEPGVPGSSNGTGPAAHFDSPSGLAVDGNGIVYVSDTGNHTIRRISAAGVVTTLAGVAGQSGATNEFGNPALFNTPLGLAVDTAGHVYVSDSGNHLIRKITPGGAITNLAGQPGAWGSLDGIGSAARFNRPVGLAVDSQGNVFVADAFNYAIRRITPAGVVTTIAGFAGNDGYTDGLGGAARFGKPAELAIDARGNLFVADSFNHTIRRVTPGGLVSTVAGRAGLDGSSDGVNGRARFFNPYGVALDPQGNLFVTDTYNQTLRSLFIPFRVALDKSSGSAVLEWDAVTGRKYRVQFCEQLAAWQDLDPIVTATGLTATLTDTTTSSGRFYRVRLVE